MYIFLNSSQETLQVCPWNRPTFGTSRETLNTSRGRSNIAAGWYWARTWWSSNPRKHGHASLRPCWIWFHGMWVQKRLLQTHQQSHRPPVDRSTQLGFEFADHRREPRIVVCRKHSSSPLMAELQSWQAPVRWGTSGWWAALWPRITFVNSLASRASAARAMSWRCRPLATAVQLYLRQNISLRNIYSG
jgi:hypothetical protein